MTLFGAVAAGLSRRGLEDPTVPITDVSLVEWLNSGGGMTNDAGVTVSATGSLAMSAVWRATTLISGVSASLPLKAYRRGDGRETVERSILWDPHPEMTGFEFWRLTYAHRCLWGNAYARKVKSATGEVVELWPLDPARMQVGRYKPSPGNPGGKVFRYIDDAGAEQVWISSDVLHLPGFGYDGVTGVSPVRAARQAIAVALAAEKYGARLFGSGTLVSGVLQTEQRLDDDQAETLKTRWQARMTGVSKSHEVAVLDSGAKFQSLTMPNKDAQFLESRQFQAREVERFFGVPPFLMMDTENSTSWGTGLEQQATAWVRFDLLPSWLAPTEQRVTKEILLDRRTYAEYVVEGLLRGDSTARANFYRVMREIGAYSANDVRRRENEPPVAGGDQYLQPLNLAPLGYVPPTQGASS